MRQAAENVLLTMALCKAEGVDGVNWTRLLEEAAFVRWLDFGAVDDEVKGLLFDTPAGPMSILWTRKDGYLLNVDHEPGQPYYPHPEAWQDDWPTETSLVLRAGRLTEVDCIGQRRTIESNRGQTTLTLDGAPRIYFGLSAQPELQVAACH
jgi:hypothetical protein